MKGFSFMELVVVVLILTILVAIGYPVYRNYIYQSRISAALLVLDDLDMKLKAALIEDKFTSATTTFKFRGQNFATNGTLIVTSALGPEITGITIYNDWGSTPRRIVTSIRVGNLSGMTYTYGGTTYNWESAATNSTAGHPYLAEVVCSIVEDTSTKILKRSCGQGYADAAWAVPLEFLPNGFKCPTVLNSPCF